MANLTKEEVQERLAHGAQLVNVLGYEDTRMIKGSKKIPLRELPGRMSELRQDKEVITYCSGPACGASKRAADWLEQSGFRASHYAGGLEEWIESGLPVDEYKEAA